VGAGETDLNRLLDWLDRVGIPFAFLLGGATLAVLVGGHLTLSWYFAGAGSAAAALTHYYRRTDT
jgi:hypothetical protein